MVILLQSVSNLKPTAMKMELDWPSSFWRSSGWNPYVQVQTVFVLIIRDRRSSVLIVDHGATVFIVRLRAYWPKLGMVTWSTCGVVEGEVRRQRLRSSPSKRSNRRKCIRYFGETMKNWFT